MTLYKEQEVQEEARTTEPNMKDLHREIAAVQIQVYKNNLALNMIEQIIQDMKRSEILGPM